MRNLLFDGRYAQMTGIGTCVRVVLAELIANPVPKNVSILLLKNHPAKNDLKNAGYLVLETSVKPFNLFESVVIGWLLRKHGFSAYHVPHFNLPIGLPKRLKTIVTIHDLALDDFPKEAKTPFHVLYYRQAMKRAIRATTLLSVSQFTQTALLARYKTPSTVLYNGFIGPKISAQKARQPFHFLVVALNKPRKNLSFLIKVFAGLPQNYRVTIVGDMRNKRYDIISDIAEQSLDSRITLTGYLSTQTLAHYYQTATALIIPSLLEGFGYPILEAAAYQLPILCASYSALPEIGGDGCLYFDPTSVTDAQEKIQALANSPDLQRSIVSKAMDNLERFKSHSMLSQLLTIYYSVTPQK